MSPGSGIIVREKDFHIMKHASSKENEVGSVQGILNRELLHIPQGEMGCSRKMQSSVQTEATSAHHWVIYYVASTTYIQVLAA